MTVQTTAPVAAASAGISRWQMPALIVGILGLIATAIGWFLSPDVFYKAYLPSWLFWFQIVAGSLAVLCLQYVTGGEWGVLIRRPLGASARTMILMAILFLPIAFGVHSLYPWTAGHLVAAKESIRFKSGYLNVTAWWIRSAVYFALWILWAWRIRYLSLDFAKSRSPYTELARRKWSAGGLLMMVLTLTFASIDWAMSLEPTWYSTMYGITFLVSCALAAFAFVTFFLTRLADTLPMSNILRPRHLRDLGNLMLAFVMFWAYTSFSEYLLTWYANLKEEIPHYLARQHGLWGAIAILIIVFHFFLPFFLLLMRSIKDRASTIAFVTVVILVMRYIATYWLVAPSYGRGYGFSWITLTSLAGIGGLWLWAFLGQLKGQSIIPIHETWVEEAIREGALTTNA
ncbi:MAG: hypothetical protein ABI837_10280 [Acidobacteriota bacterium]